MNDGGFEGPHNGAITWRHLLQQTSEWEGTLFGKSDVDRPQPPARRRRDTGRRACAPLRPPGSFWEYNDVRVNRLSLALLRLFRRPLPEVFAERIMRPIGASDDWGGMAIARRWSRSTAGMIESVSGGTHWGGGMEIHAEDQARIGMLMLQPGRVATSGDCCRRLDRGIADACALNPLYGLCGGSTPDASECPARRNAASSPPARAAT